MSNPTIRIHDAETNEVIDREMTASELTAYKADQAKAKAIEESINQAELAKEAAQAKLAALGLTTDDLKALGL